MAYWRVYYTEHGRVKMPIRSDIVIRALSYTDALRKAVKMFRGFKLVDIKEDRKATRLT